MAISRFAAASVILYFMLLAPFQHGVVVADEFGGELSELKFGHRLFARE
tara:strand:+ start:170 stop:316 length:147 start_codon:yes stop_codon:yes gene_type:complete